MPALIHYAAGHRRHERNWCGAREALAEEAARLVREGRDFCYEEVRPGREAWLRAGREVVAHARRAP